MPWTAPIGSFVAVDPYPGLNGYIWAIVAMASTLPSYLLLWRLTATQGITGRVVESLQTDAMVGVLVERL